jgi:hypothetical protein
MTDFIDDGFSAATFGRKTDLGDIDIKSKNRNGNNDDIQNQKNDCSNFFHEISLDRKLK